MVCPFLHSQEGATVIEYALVASGNNAAMAATITAL